MAKPTYRIDFRIDIDTVRPFINNIFSENALFVITLQQLMPAGSRLQTWLQTRKVEHSDVEMVSFHLNGR